MAAILLLLSTFARAAFVGCYNDDSINPWMSVQAIDANSCPDDCFNPVFGVAAVKSSAWDHLTPCKCSDAVPSSDNLVDCTDDTWRVYDSSDNAWSMWGCLDPGGVYQLDPNAGINPGIKDCWEPCFEWYQTKWAVIQAGPYGQWYCGCTNDIPSGLSPIGCHPNSFFMYTNNND